MEIGYNPSATRKCMNSLIDLRHFVTLCEKGLAWAIGTPRQEIAQVLSKMNVLTKDDTQSMNEELAKVVELAVCADSHADTGFTYFYQLVTTKVWSLLETMADEVVFEALHDYRNPRVADALSALKGDIGPILTLEARDLRSYIVSKIKENTRARLKDGVGRFSAMLDAVGIHGPIDDVLRRVLCELGAVRNVIIHSNGNADKQFLDRCPWLGRDLGDPIQPRSGEFSLYWLAAGVFVAQVSTWEQSATGNNGLGLNVEITRDGLFKVFDSAARRYLEFLRRSARQKVRE